MSLFCALSTLHRQEDMIEEKSFVDHVSCRVNCRIVFGSM